MTKYKYPDQEMEKDFYRVKEKFDNAKFALMGLENAIAGQIQNPMILERECLVDVYKDIDRKMTELNDTIVAISSLSIEISHKWKEIE